MSQATPRKFSEKIAILERKQNEEQEQFNSVMRDVRTITSSGSRPSSAANSPFASPSSVGSNNADQQHQPQQQQQQLQSYGGPQSNDSSNCSKLSPEGPHPLTANWNRASGSLPNVHQMVQQQQPMQQATAGGVPLPYGVAGGMNASYSFSPSWTNMTLSMTNSNESSNSQIQQQHGRTRSPGAPHFHPYRNGMVVASGSSGAVVNANGNFASGRHERLSQGEAKAVRLTTGMNGGAGPIHLQPPDPSWPKAKSDPAIHTNAMMTMMDPNFAYPLYPGGQMPSNLQWPQTHCDTKILYNGSATAPSTAQLPSTHASNVAAFFPSNSPTYPLSAQQQLTNNSMFTLPSQQQQQFFISPQVSAAADGVAQTQQFDQTISSSTSAMPIGQQQQQCFLADFSVGSLPNMNPLAAGIQMQQQQQQNQQQINNNINSYGVNLPSGLINNNNVMAKTQQQQMMPNNNQNNQIIYQQQQQQLNNQQPFNATSYMCTANPSGMYIKMPPSAFSNASAAVQQPQMQQQQQLATPNNLCCMSSSQSAPTTPAVQTQLVENPLLCGTSNSQQQQQWQSTHFSASPDGLEVPNICVTGTDGSLDVDCFQEFQDLNLDSETLQMLKDSGEHEQVDPACESQLLS